MRTVRIAGWALVWAGLIILGYVGFELFGTGLLTSRVQTEARNELAAAFEDGRLEGGVVVPPVTSAPEPGPPELVPEPVPAEGEPFATIRIPAIGVDDIVFGGVTTEVLRQGPGHLPGTAVPGQPGNAVLSGHRTTYGAPFSDLDRLGEGDLIEIETVIGVHQYAVREAIVVEPTDVWVADPRPGAWLTLTTCTPRWSSRQRLVVFAELTAGPNLHYVRST